MNSKSLIRDVSDTALWVATYRARESERQDALFHDPFARALAGDYGALIAEKMQYSPYTEWTVVIRTHVIDQLVYKLLDLGVDTFLNLGAGLDTRPYRMDLPESVRWVEVDFQNILDLKKSILQNEKPRCHLESVSLDLSKREERNAFLTELNQRSKKIAVITEGLLPYLANPDVESLAQDLHSQPGLQYWIAEYNSPHVTKHLLSPQRAKLMGGAPFKFCPQDWFQFFLQLGWKEKETCYLVSEGHKVERNLPFPWWMKLLRLLSPKTNEVLSKMSAYVLLEKDRL